MKNMFFKTHWAQRQWCLHCPRIKKTFCSSLRIFYFNMKIKKLLILIVFTEGQYFSPPSDRNLLLRLGVSSTGRRRGAVSRPRRLLPPGRPGRRAGLPQSHRPRRGLPGVAGRRPEGLPVATLRPEGGARRSRLWLHVHAEERRFLTRPAGPQEGDRSSESSGWEGESKTRGSLSWTK